MPASKSDIQGWLAKAQEKGATHLIVRCDPFDYHGGGHDGCCYPVEVMPGEDPRERSEDSGDRLMEVYSLTGKHAIEEQMSEVRAFHYD